MHALKNKVFLDGSVRFCFAEESHQKHKKDLLNLSYYFLLHYIMLYIVSFLEYIQFFVGLLHWFQNNKRLHGDMNTYIPQGKWFILGYIVIAWFLINKPKICKVKINMFQYEDILPVFSYFYNH